MSQCGSGIDDLVEGEQAEVDGHDLDDGAHPTERGADTDTDESQFRQRRVTHPIRTELLEEAFRGRVGATVAADIFTHQHDSVVSGQRVTESVVHRSSIAHLHATLPGV